NKSAVRRIDEDIRFVENPLEGERSRAVGFDDQSGIGACGEYQIRWLRGYFCSKAGGECRVRTGLRAKEVEHADRIITGVTRLCVADNQGGVGRVGKVGAVQAPLVVQRLG